MLGEFLQIGDKVSITIEKDSRDWGYNPCPDGTIAEVVGFEEIHYGRTKNFGHEPGVYENRSWIKLVMPNGKTRSEWIGRLTLVNTADLEQRKKDGWRQKNDHIRLRDLPETKFWEGDVISCEDLHFEDFGGDSKRAFIFNINYSYMESKNVHGDPWPFYDISPDMKGGLTTSRPENAITLTERGNVWKYYHNEPLEFPDLREEADFYYCLGFAKEVRNPRTGNYSWNGYQELRDAVKSGLGDAVFGKYLYKFNEKCPADLGRRVAAEME